MASSGNLDPPEAALTVMHVSFSSSQSVVDIDISGLFIAHQNLSTPEVQLLTLGRLFCPYRMSIGSKLSPDWTYPQNF